MLQTMAYYSLKSYLQIFLYKNNKNNVLAAKHLLKQLSFKSLFKTINWRYISNRKRKIAPWFWGSHIKRSITQRGKDLHEGMLSRLPSFDLTQYLTPVHISLTKSLFTRRWESPGRWGNPLRWANVPACPYISHFNLIMVTWLVGWPATCYLTCLGSPTSM